MGVAAPIGVFDSGVGGLSVLRHLRAQLPREDFLYFADSGFAPYGEKPETVIVQRSLAIGAFLVAQGAKAIVVACNTATAAAIEALRAAYPGMPVVGVEPGLKPGIAASRNGRIGVMATGSTLASAKFRRLLGRLEGEGAQFFLQACNGLADQIEKGELRSPATFALLQRYVGPLLQDGVDTLVLGCTHYPLVQPLIEEIAGPQVQVIDTGKAVAQQLERLLQAAGLMHAGSGGLRLFTSGSKTSMERACLVFLGQPGEATVVRD